MTHGVDMDFCLIQIALRLMSERAKICLVDYNIETE